jgi:exodeoxyribonuclease VII large subunit
MLRQKLASIDPKAVLQRGYAVVSRKNGIIPHSVSELTLGENLVIQLAQGKVTVKVIEVTEG